MTVDNVSDPSPDDGGSLGLSDEQIVSKEIDEVVLVRLVFSDGRWLPYFRRRSQIDEVCVPTAPSSWCFLKSEAVTGHL